MILAVAVIVWSDAAVASFVCPHMSACGQGMTAAADSTAGAQNAVEAMPCCPEQPQAAMECGGSPMECCAWERDSETFAIVVASDHQRPRPTNVALPVTTAAPATLIAYDHDSGLTDHLPYLKPVSQKKTDLRI
jgi:hypothetical protein